MSAAGSASLTGRSEKSVGDRYLAILLFSLAAYAVTGKGFAYAGVPPIFVGEIILLLGFLTLVRSISSVALFTNLPNIILLALMVWTLMRTIPYIGEYKVDALRDSVIVMYGLFAFIVANLILEHPERISVVVRAAGRFFTFFGYVAAILYIFPKQLGSIIPAWPISGMPMMALRGGEVAVHLGGAAVLSILGLRRSTPLWLCMLIVGIVVISAQSRGGMLAIVVPVGVAVLLGGKLREAILIASLLLPAFLILNLVDFEITLPPDHRTIRVGQLMDNVTSIFLSTGNDVLDGTKVWRLQWWESIVNYTLHGPYFWGGKGFGINLAISDGFLGGEEPPLRSPHNAHMTMLGRAGVPGLTLWIILNVSWIGMMLRGVFQARRHGNEEWSHLMLFVLCYLIGVLINSSFDVALEGPMLGILFWSLFGFGVGLTMVYRALCEESRRGA